MAQTAANVRVGVSGGAYHAPAGTALPTNATDALAAAFAEVGYLGEDGVTENTEADFAEIKAFQNGSVVRKVQTSHDLSYTFTMIETNQESLRVFYGDATAAVGKTEVRPEQAGPESWVLEVLDSPHTARIVLPSAQVTERGEVVYKNDEPVGYEVTLTAYEDESGVKAYKYADTGAGAKPSVTSILPTGEAPGALVIITGANFTGTTAISMDAKAVTDYEVISDHKIAMVIPAAVSGAAVTTVTNATGTSDAYNYTATGA